MLAEGVQARVIMQTLGHSQISITLNTYGHVSPDLSRDAADRMESPVSRADDALAAKIAARKKKRHFGPAPLMIMLLNRPERWSRLGKIERRDLRITRSVSGALAAVGWRLKMRLTRHNSRWLCETAVVVNGCDVYPMCTQIP